jgi:hypothetical protein
VTELIRFAPEAPDGAALHVWDRVDGALQRREVIGTRAPSLVLPLTWVIAPAEGNVHALRILDPSGQAVPTRVEARRAAVAAREAEATARKAEAAAREAAEARVRELQALLDERNQKS